MKKLEMSIIKMQDGLNIEKNGSKAWYLNGKYHRVDGPAVEYTNGHKYWYINDELHRVDGPAMETQNGNNHWFLNNCRYEYEDWLKQPEVLSYRRELERMKKLEMI